MASPIPRPVPVAAIGTGNVGRHALTQLTTDPRFELTAVWVSSESKAGRDAAELAGLRDSTGILATTDLDADGDVRRLGFRRPARGHPGFLRLAWGSLPTPSTSA